MANDRMAIVCSLCNKGLSIAKYYPSGGFISGDGPGWGQYPLNVNRMDDFFKAHMHNFDANGFSGKQYFLGYESDGKKWEYEEGK